jgi:hypothetical protein
MQNWRAKSRANREQFESNMAAVVNTFAAVAADSAQGMGVIAAQRAMDRIKAAAAAKQAEQQKAINSLVNVYS